MTNKVSGTYEKDTGHFYMPFFINQRIFLSLPEPAFPAL